MRTGLRGRGLSRKRWAGVLARAGLARVSRSRIWSSVIMGTVFSSKLGGSMSARGFSSTCCRSTSQPKNRFRRRYWALMWPLESFLGLSVGPLPKPAGAFLEVSEVFLEVLGADLLYVRPALLLGVQAGHGRQSFRGWRGSPRSTGWRPSGC